MGGLLGSLTLQVEDPGWQALSGNNHASGVGQIRLSLVLNLQVGDLARVERTRQLRSQVEVRVVEGHSELALLVKRVLEVDTDWFGAWCALDWALWLWGKRLTEEEARVLHALGAGQLEHTTAVTNRERLVPHIDVELDTLLVLGSGGRYLRHVALEIASTWTVDTLNLNGIVRRFLKEVEELEGLHLVLTERALEGKGAL